MPGLITVDDACATLGPRVAARPDLLDLIAAASAAVEHHCRRGFELLPVDERLDGTGSPRLLVSRPPIASVGAVEVDGVALDNSNGLAWLATETGLTRGDGRRDPRCQPTWPKGTANIRVQYSGGFDPIPAQVRYATLLLVQHLAEAAAHTGLLRREKIGDYEYEMSLAASSSDDLPATVRALLHPFVLPLYA